MTNRYSGSNTDAVDYSFSHSDLLLEAYCQQSIIELFKTCCHPKFKMPVPRDNADGSTSYIMEDVDIFTIVHDARKIIDLKNTQIRKLKDKIEEMKFRTISKTPKVRPYEKPWHISVQRDEGAEP